MKNQDLRKDNGSSNAPWSPECRKYGADDYIIIGQDFPDRYDPVYGPDET